MADLQALPEPLSARVVRHGSRSHALLRLVRKIHLYFGVFISPALLFFAFTGAMQTFSLHEQTRGSSYKPPAWIATLAQLHKKQTTEVNHRPRPNDPASLEQQHSPSTSAQNPVATGRRRHDNAGQPQASPQNESPANSGQANAATTDRTPAATAPRPKSHLPLKIFFLIVSVGLFLSTITGIYMSYKYTRRPWIITALLLAGVILPLLLLPL